MTRQWIDSSHCAAGLVLSVTLCSAVTASWGQISIVTICAVSMIVFSCLLTGRAIRNVLSLPFPESARFPADMLLGTAALAVAMLLFCLAFHLSAGSAFLVSSVPGLALSFYWKPGGAESAKIFAPMLASFVGGISVIWSWQAIRSFPRLLKEGVFLAWSDFFLHSAIIAQFAHFSALGGSSIFSYGDRIPLYHWASYMLPAVICSFTDAPALVVATTVWILFGWILMVLGAWALGAILADWVGAAAAVAIVLLVPSAAHYGFRNPFFDFAWILQISAGLSYGSGLGLLTICLSVLALRNRSFVALATAAAVAIAEALFKIHLIAVLVPACATFVVLSWRGTRTKARVRLLACLVAAGFVLLLAADKEERAPHFFSGPHEVSSILNLMLTMEPAAAPKLYPRMTASMPNFVAVPAGVLLVVAEAFGLLLPAYVIGWAYCWKRGLSQSEDYLPALLVACYCLVVWSFPTTTFTGSIEEYQHRTFVLVYCALAVWCGYFAVRLLRDLQPRHGVAQLAVCGAVLLPTPFLLEKTAQADTMIWSKPTAFNPIAKGLLRSALYIRQFGAANDMMLASDGKEEGMLISLSERRTLMALGPNYDKGLGYRKEAMAQRLDLADQFKGAKSYQQILEIAREHSLQWYVAAPGSALSGEIRSKAAMCSEGYCVMYFGKQ